MLINRCIFIIVLLLPTFAFAQREKEQTRSDVNLNDGAQLASQMNDSRLLAIAYYQLGHFYSDRNLFREAIASYEKSKDGFERAGLTRDEVYVLADLGALYFIQEDYKKARECSERSLHISEGTSGVPAGAFPDDFGKARALLTLGDLDTHDGNYDQAVQKLQNSLALYGRLNGSGSSYDLYIAGVYGALGRAYPEMGDSISGLVYLNKALDIAEHHSDKRLTASLRNDIGYLYLEQEDYAQASAQFSESLKIYEAENNKRECGRELLNLGVTEQRRSNYDDALRYFRRSIESATITGALDIQIAAYEGIGVVLSAKKDFPGATEVLNRGLTIAKNTSNKTRQTELLWRLAQVNYETGNYAQSITLAESAVDLARASHLPKLTYLTLTTLGESYAAQRKYDLAVETLKQAVRQLEALRDQVAGSDIETQLFLEDKVAPYYLLADLLIQRDKPFEAITYAERAKGRVLLDVLSEDRSHLTGVLTPGEKERRQRLNRNISEVNEEIRKAEVNKSATLDSLYLRLDTARLEAQSFQDALFTAHPKTRIRSGHTDMLDRLEIESLALDRDCAYLEYVVSKDHVSLFVLTKGKSTDKLKLNFYPLSATPNELAQKVDRFHDRLANQHPDYPDDARDLYSLLVAPAADILKGVDTLCIIPDGFLWNLPFQALMSSSDRFLLGDHAISYLPSLSVFREMSRNESNRRNANSLIAFGNPVIGKDEQGKADLCPLPEAENEVGSIAKTARVETQKVFIGRDASEKTFKTLAPSFSLIHLATHGVLDNRNPLYSHLLLTRTEGDVENDGLLEAREIMDMKLDADLAVLSACDTANGRIAPGEGVMGMSWAFFVAGTRSMLVSQWKVNSSSTSQLMVNFYQQSDILRHKSGSTNARALRAAALQLMKDDRYSHPFFWAGFVLIGVNQTQ
ncbi:MAG TPA: CHAT domain-containing protein [Pyrinomonadaceae bacterium]|jgi:CHAT domain-containing protein/tetratricopeptide (TPR) repeat protein|nr:CHAT domain-containing protein [Pyrinomonadaceae bacterium]